MKLYKGAIVAENVHINDEQKQGEAMKTHPLKFVIAGGGTGGHIFPAIAIAHAIKKQSSQAAFLFVGAKGKMEMEKVPQAGFKIVGIDIAGFNRSSLIKNIGLPLKLIKSFFQVRKIFKSFQPDAVIGVGGYSSFPVLRYAQSKGIKTFIHESNSYAGKSNKMLGKKATKIFVAIDGMDVFFPAEKIVISGNPLRQSLINHSISREKAIQFFGLDPKKKTILSIGGSLGAKNINEAIAADINFFERNQLQLIWQTGKPFAERAQQVVKSSPHIWVNDFITQMDYAYAAADVVISRSGAMSVGELCVMKKPTVFVPFPFAAEDHQTVNAKKMVDKQAASMVNDKNALTELLPAILALVKDEVLQEMFRNNMGPLGIKNADEIIAKEILESLGDKN